MATLTEKQEAVKEILGSTDSIRKFVQAEGIHLEELKGYVNLLQIVIKEEEEKARVELDKEIESTFSIMRAKLIDFGYTPDEADKRLGKNSSGSESKSGNSKTNSIPVKYKFSWTKKDGSKDEKERGVKGQIKDESMKAYMDEKEYFNIDEKTKNKSYSLQKWVNAEGLKPVTSTVTQTN